MIVEKGRAKNTGLYVYTERDEGLESVKVQKEDIKKFVQDLKGGETFNIEKKHFAAEWRPELIFLKFTVIKVYPNFVMCVGPDGFHQGLTYADVYFAMKNKKGEK
jgi:hypothetical protein